MAKIILALGVLLTWSGAARAASWSVTESCVVAGYPAGTAAFRSCIAQLSRSDRLLDGGDGGAADAPSADGALPPDDLAATEGAQRAGGSAGGPASPQEGVDLWLALSAIDSKLPTVSSLTPVRPASPTDIYGFH